MRPVAAGHGPHLIPGASVGEFARALRMREIITPEGVPICVTLASAGERAAAFLVDAVIIVLALVLVVTLAVASAMASGEVGMTVATLGVFLLINAYFPWFEIRWQGRTPGKRMLGLRVIDARGGQLLSEAIFARNLVRNVEVVLPLALTFGSSTFFPGVPGWLRFAALVWLLIFMGLPIFNRDRLRIGDLVGGTRVVLAPKATLLADLSRATRKAATAARYEFTPPQLAIYGEYELQVLEQVLRRDDAVDAQVTRRAVAERIQQRIRWDGDPRKVDVDRFLRDFYAALRSHLEDKLRLGNRKANKFSK